MNQSHELRHEDTTSYSDVSLRTGAYQPSNPFSLPSLMVFDGSVCVPLAEKTPRYQESVHTPCMRFLSLEQMGLQLHGGDAIHAVGDDVKDVLQLHGRSSEVRCLRPAI